MVGRSVLLYVSLATLLLPTVLADRAEDDAGDALLPIAQYDILALDVASSGSDLVLTFQTAGDMQGGLSGWYAVNFEEGGRSIAVVCFIENSALFGHSESCYAIHGDERTPIDITWSDDGSAWTGRVPLSDLGLTGGSVLEDVRAYTRTLVGTLQVIATGQPVDLDTLAFDGPVRLAGP